MQCENVKTQLENKNINYVSNQELKNKNTFKLSSTAEIFVQPKTIADFQNTIQIAAKSELPYFVLGGGSNIVLPEHYSGIIISTESLNQISISDYPQDKNKKLVTCLAGTPTTAFVNFCTKNLLSGAEQFAGLPGSLGGACFMNARCFEKSISDILYSTEHLEFFDNCNTQIISSNLDSSKWDYKVSPFQPSKSNKQKYVLSATFLLDQKTEDFQEIIESECKKYISERVDKGHFKFPSAGSVFKNNHAFGAPSGKIIDEAGLRGTQIGGAKIADFHANFIVNFNNATQKDIKDLVCLTQKTIKEKFGFLLEPEIIFVDK